MLRAANRAHHAVEFDETLKIVHECKKCRQLGKAEQMAQGRFNAQPKEKRQQTTRS